MKDEETYNCDCCGEVYEESEMCLVDGALICVECVEQDLGEHSFESRLSVWERNR